MTLSKYDPPEKLLDDKGIRIDGRKFDDLRPIEMKVGVLPNCDGSAYVRMGGNKIIAGIYGPRKVQPRHLAHPNKVVLRTLYRMATFSVDERKSPAPSRREVELSMVIRNALLPAIFVRYYPKTLVDVTIQVLAADGGTRCACINAASLALADAGIAQKDLVSAVAVGKIEDKIVLDLNDIEDKEGQADLPIAIMPQSKFITLLQFDGNMTQAEFLEAMDLGIKGIDTIYEMQQAAIRTKFLEGSESMPSVSKELSEGE
jgi:exosome complex component RRP41